MIWYAVRIEHPDENTTLFTVSDDVKGGGEEVIGLDSTPAVIAVLKAHNPADAAKLAWERGHAEVEASCPHGRRPPAGVRLFAAT